MTTPQVSGTVECSVCYEPKGILLDCGGNHPLCPSCLQQFVTKLGGPKATNDQGPKGLLIAYVNLPFCPLCKRRIHLAPHVADPMGLDNFPNNHPDPTKAPQYYYDDYEGLTPDEVQTFVFDAAQDAIAAVDNMESDDDQDAETDYDTDGDIDYDTDDDDQKWRDDLTFVADNLDLDAVNIAVGELLDADLDAVDLDAAAVAMGAWIQSADWFTTALDNDELPLSVQDLAQPIPDVIIDGLRGKVTNFVRAAAKRGYNVDQVVNGAYDRIWQRWVD
jgi:hypothetical protein